MNFSVLTRDPEDVYKQRIKENAPFHRNVEPMLHPFRREREFQRALTAVKLEKMMAKPFLHSFDGHNDPVYSLTTTRNSVEYLFSGSGDGDIIFWNLATKRPYFSAKNHNGFVTGLTTTNDDKYLLACGDDSKVNAYSIPISVDLEDYDTFMKANSTSGNLIDQVSDSLSSRVLENKLAKEIKPFRSFSSKFAFNSIDASWDANSPLFITASRVVELWDTSRSAPVLAYGWNEGCDKLTSVSFNRSEHHIAVATGSDRTVGIYDTRSKLPLRKVVLASKANRAKFNPQHPDRFTCACEDGTLHTYDIRHLERATMVHKDFTNAVTDLDYSPTGTEFVASSYDKTIRIFPTTGSRSREIYHTKRMQEVHSVTYTPDSRFVLSGSNDMCIRLWKSDVSRPVGTPSIAEKRSLAYRQKLKERYQHEPEVRRIANHRHLPKLVKTKTKTRKELETSERNKIANIQRHTKKEVRGKDIRKPVKVLE